MLYRLAHMALGRHPPQRITLEARHLAGTEVRAAALDHMRQLAGSVVGITLMPFVETHLVGQPVHPVIAESRDFAVLVRQRGQTARTVVVVAQRVSQCIHPEQRRAGAVVLPRGGVPQRVHIPNEIAFAIPGVVVLRAVGLGHLPQLPVGIEHVGGFLAQRIGAAAQMPQRVIGLAGGVARAIRVGEHVARFVPLQGLALVQRIDDGHDLTQRIHLVQCGVA